MAYRIVEEWACPTYVDYNTNETLYDECSTNVQGLWVVEYDEVEKEIMDWLERFEIGEVEKARDYIKQLEKGE